MVIIMKTNNKLTAALVVSIIGLILSLVFALGGLIVCAIGLVMAVKARAKALGGKATGAMVCSIVGLAFSVLNMIAGAVLAVM